MAMVKRDYEFTRININLPSDLVARIKDYSNKVGISVTSAYSILLNDALEQKELFKNMPALVSLMKDLKETSSSEKK